MRIPRRATIVAAALLAGAVIAPATVATAAADPSAGGGQSQHVLLLSVDGLHQSDLSWYVSHHPNSALAALARHGLDFTNARTPFPVRHRSIDVLSSSYAMSG